MIRAKQQCRKMAAYNSRAEEQYLGMAVGFAAQGLDGSWYLDLHSQMRSQRAAMEECAKLLHKWIRARTREDKAGKRTKTLDALEKPSGRRTTRKYTYV